MNWYMRMARVMEHRQEDIRTKGDCCFNHIIGLPRKDGIESMMKTKIS
jgi:hypothetical protein